MAAGGLRRFLYGGDAFLYHVTLAEYEEMLGWMAGFPDDHWAIPSVGPSFGPALDQALSFAAIASRWPWPAVQRSPGRGRPRGRDARDRGSRGDRADPVPQGGGIVRRRQDRRASMRSPGSSTPACASGSNTPWYAPIARRSYLEALLERVDRRFVISGMGERPAVAHLKGFDLPGSQGPLTGAWLPR